jgi:hypothetical protein
MICITKYVKNETVLCPSATSNPKLSNELSKDTYMFTCHVRWNPVTTAWRVIRLRMKERPAAMEGSCEYLE